MTNSFLIDAAQAAIEVVFTSKLRSVMALRSQEAFDILMEELRNGRITPEQAAANDTIAAGMVKYFVAAAQGAAFRNLRVIAQIWSNAAFPDRVTDDFVALSDAVAGMRREETIFLAVLQRELNKEPRPSRRIWDANIAARAELLSKKVIDDGEDYTALGFAMSRTGLVYHYPFSDAHFFTTATLMDRLEQFIKLDQWADASLAGEN